MPYWNGYGMQAGWVGPLVMLVLMMLVLGGLATAVVVALRRQARPGDDALRILDQRYARGEIDQEEYEQRRTVLKR